MTRFSRDLCGLMFSPGVEFTEPDCAHLSSILRLFLECGVESAAFVAAKQQLLDDLLNLALATKLFSPVLRSICLFFECDGADRPLPTNLRLSQAHKNNLVRMEYPIVKRSSAANVGSLVERFYRSAAWSLIRKLLSKNELSFGQISAILQIFCCTYSFLDDTVCVALVRYFAEYVIRLQRRFDGHPMIPVIRFLVKFVAVLEDLWPRVLCFLIDVALRWSDPTFTHALSLVQFARAAKVTDDNVLRQLKDGILSIVQRCQKFDVLSELYQYLGDCKLSFAASEIDMLLAHGPSLKDNCGLAVVSLLGRVNEPLARLCSRLLVFGVFCPILHLTLVERCEDEGMSRALFSQVLTFCQGGVVDLKMCAIGQRLEYYIGNEIGDTAPNLVALCYLLASLRRTHFVHEFLMKLASSWGFPAGLGGALVDLFKSLDRTESETILLFFFNRFVEQMPNTTRRKRIAPLAAVIVKWIELSQQISESLLFQPLVNVDFGHCPDYLPPVVTAVAQKSGSNQNIRSFVLKLMKETVPPRHARWAIELAIMSMQDDRKEVDEIGEQLFDSLCEEHKRRNAVHMLYWMAVLESDFVKNPDGLTFMQPVVVDRKEFSISLHPFQSARRVFFEVARRLRLSYTRFGLTLIDTGVRLKMDTPLSVLPIHWKKPIVMKTIATDVVSDDVSDFGNMPRLLDVFVQPESQALLFQYMKDIDPESEVLFQILTLFGDLGIQAPPIFPLQNIFKQSFLMSFEHSDSIRVFPFVIRLASLDQDWCTAPFLGQIFRLLREVPLDVVSLGIACST
jgi:hypothetical protein